MNGLQRTIIGLAAMAVPATASAQVIDFEGLGPTGCQTGDASVVWIPNGYAGFYWTHMKAVNSCTYKGTGGEYGVTSGNYVGANWFGATGVMYVPTGTFTLHGNVFLTAAFADGQVAHLSGWRGSTMLFEDFVTLKLMTPTSTSLDGWSGIDRVEFESGGTPFAIDDLDPVLDPAVVTPEPATLLLLGSGLAGVAGVVRRRKPTNQA